jgi:hypothetical protein
MRIGLPDIPLGRPLNLTDLLLLPFVAGRRD